MENVVVVGCGACSAQCGTGGTEGVKKIISNLERENINVLGSVVSAEPCDKREARKDLRLIRSALNNSDGVIVAACGSGGQTIAELTDKPTIITTDSVMISQTERIGVYHEKCRACGQCLLNETGGICPITQCQKSMLNGPCSGMVDGKCEVGDYANSCAWVDIYHVLEKRNQLEFFKKFRAPVNWGRTHDKLTLKTREEMKTYYDCE